MPETSTDTTSQDTADSTEGSDAGTTEQTATQTVTSNTPTSFEWDGESVDQLPEGVQKMIRDARKEAGDYRAAKNTAATDAAKKAETDLINKILAASGRTPEGDEQPDADKLAKDLAASNDSNRETKVELAVYRTASDHQGDPVALLDSRAFLAKVHDLDPSAEDFSTAVGEAIKTAVADNPKLKSARAAGKGGSEFTGGSGEGAITKEQFKNMNGAERNDLARRDPTTYDRLSGRT